MGLDLKKGWIAAKKKFETVTGKKKPSASLKGIFSKPSGLEPAFGKLDKAIEAYEKNKDPKKAEKLHKAAYDQLEAVRNVDRKYFSTISGEIDAEIKNSNDPEGNYNGPLSTLVNDCDDLTRSAQEWLRKNKPE